jgi:hypothetical protein
MPAATQNGWMYANCQKWSRVNPVIMLLIQIPAERFLPELFFLVKIRISLTIHSFFINKDW